MKGELNVVVVGAGSGGLGAALALSRAGHSVTLVERDDTPMPRDVESAFEWNRRGAPQLQHPHAFLGLARTIVRDRFPDVLQALGEVGVRSVPMGIGLRARPTVHHALAADDDLKLLACRRTTFEWVLRQRVMDEANVRIRLGSGVVGVTANTGVDSIPVVTGVELEDGSVLDADLVVAATGRRGDVPSWLAVHGAEVPETAIDTGVVYFSRFYRTDHGQDLGFRASVAGGLMAGVIGADAGTYSVTAVVDKNDRELRTHLSDSERFDATIRLLPEMADVAAAQGTPINAVHCMTGLINRQRRYVDAEGNPVVLGLVACGDAHTCTNPAYGRGVSLALLQATQLTDAVAACDDLESVVRHCEAATAARVEPWYHASVLSDRMRATARDSTSSPIARDETGRGGGFDLIGFVVRRSDNFDLVRTALRVLHLLEPPETLMALIPEMQAAATAPDGEAPETPLGPSPSRDELLAVVA